MKSSKSFASSHLKQLSVDELLTLRDRVAQLLEGRVEQERRDLEARLNRLQRFKSGSAKSQRGIAAAAGSKRAKHANGKLAGKKVPPKFRNPENSSETWTGRGLQPRWLSAAIKGGKTIEDFRIST